MFLLEHLIFIPDLKELDINSLSLISDVIVFNLNNIWLEKKNPSKKTIFPFFHPYFLYL